MTRLGRYGPALAVALLVPAPVRAEPPPAATADDSRIVTVEVAPGEAIRVNATPGYEVLVLMPHGERIRQALIADNAGWKVSLTPARDGMTLVPMHSVSGTSLAVLGDQRTYEFILAAGNDTRAPVVMRLVNQPKAGSPTTAQSRPAVPTAVYRLSGDKRLWPVSITDDGQKVYIAWDDSQPIPAVFAVDAQGHEEMTDGYMRDGRFTLDRLCDHLVFRIDKVEAGASREIPKATRK